MITFCCDLRRRGEVRGGPFNGIDFIEVIDLDAATKPWRQRIIHVHLINPPGALVLDANNVVIESTGGRAVTVTNVIMGPDPNADEPDGGLQTNVVAVEVDRPGDYAPYRLRLRQSLLDDSPPVGFDARLAEVTFSFKVECPSDFDCQASCDCGPDTPEPPPIDYLARDYDSFRTLMLDRMAQIAPDWDERNPADLGVALVELLAYVGDRISYAQDSAHTEAYIGRARRRVSMRRHARLVDYLIGEGLNARTVALIAVSADLTPLNPGDPPVLPAGTRLTTALAGTGVLLPPTFDFVDSTAVMFETMNAVVSLFAAHDRLPFYAWSDQRCCLLPGATSATLRGNFPNLQPGDILVFEEVIGPRTGIPADADRTRRQAVRLATVQTLDAANAPLTDPVTGQLITEITWDPEDALTATFCLSAETDSAHGARFIDDVSVARGNAVLIDHGLTIPVEDLGRVPHNTVARVRATTCDPCTRPDPAELPARYAPPLARSPVTQAEPVDFTAAMSLALVRDPSEARPQVFPTSDPGTLAAADWRARRDLLASGAFDNDFVVEVENDGTATLRFGDDTHGRRPPAETPFVARYRIGNGRAGNIGSDALAHIQSQHPEINGVRNPLPATGGADPETMDQVRARAPYAFRIQERAVTRDDYADVTQRDARVQRAKATFRNTGSWQTVFLTIDRIGGLAVDEPFRHDIRGFVERYRLAGRDLEVDPPRFVPLELELQVCVAPEYFRGDVEAALLSLFARGCSSGGRPGLFDPDNFTFGQTVYLSPWIAAAQKVQGVSSVTATVFQRLNDPESSGLDDAELKFDRLEIAELDNDPSHPERGVFRLNLTGGK
jgi:hypothetical protein